MTDLTAIKECPDCASPNIVHSLERDQIICRDCGLIYEPLTPEEEAQFAQTHNLALAPRKAKPVKKAAKKPVKKAKKKR